MTLRFDGQVAIVTGAGNGLGRSHALALAERGAKVVVNDLGGSRDGSGGSTAAAEEVVDLIKSKGGDAIAHGANVAKMDEVEDMVAQALSAWGRVDVLINNAGILRDKSFAKMTMDDFRLVMDVHLMGSVYCSKAVWETMREQQYGRIVMTTSSSGLYGNFGQSNYGAAKMAVVGFMNTLGLEGASRNIRVNALSPTAATRMTEDIMPEEVLAMLKPEAVTPAALLLAHESAPDRHILAAGAGGYALARMYETDGIFVGESEQTPETLQAQWQQLTDTKGQAALEAGMKQSEKFLHKALELYNKS